MLAGAASIEGRVGGSPPDVDMAQYTTVGLAALPGANDGDDVLQLGGPTAEYAACPAQLVLPQVFDGAALHTSDRADTVSTTLALVPCAGDLLGDQGPRASWKCWCTTSSCSVSRPAVR